MSKPEPTPFAIPPTSELYRDGKHIRSRADGRYIMFRGVCFGPVAKLDPYLPFRRREDFEEFETYLDLLLACGFTTLRLAFIWHALEPTCDTTQPVYNEQYADDFFYFVERLGEKGFTTFIDVHQDLVTSEFGGGGLPKWIKQDGKSGSSWMLNTPLWGINYVFNKALRKTFTQFWKNDLTNTEEGLVNFKVLDRYCDMIEYVANRSARIQSVLGIEVINEPHPAELESETFESGILSDLYRECIVRIRKHSKALFIMLSPQSDWNVNVRVDKNYRSHLSVDESNDNRLVFAYHYYDGKLTALHGLHFDDSKRPEYADAMAIGVREAERRGMVPFLTEFGSRQNWMRNVTRRHMHWHYEAIERSAVHATYWNVNLYNTAKTRDGFMQEDFSLLDHKLEPRNLDMAVRPYPIASSAEPVRIHYNDHSHSFELLLQGKPSGEPTVIYLPYTIDPLGHMPAQYREGFKVYYSFELADEVRAEFLPAVNQLHIWLDPTIEEHRIMIVTGDRSIVANQDQMILEVASA
ncbi:MAG TPA: cellulase family glycosylhydrolase [Candidatus Kapabacteria bacterium]|nr:cellulase family glycosylhydrolase [Candidatus Kapabacteria bacterium]